LALSCDSWRRVARITSEQINELPLALGIVEDMSIRQHIESQIEQHGGWKGISIGTILEIWLS
jgi:hypothetical protein